MPSRTTTTTSTADGGAGAQPTPDVQPDVQPDAPTQPNQDPGFLTTEPTGLQAGEGQGLTNDAPLPQDNATLATAGLNMAAEDPSDTYTEGVSGAVNTAVPAEAKVTSTYEEALEVGYLGYAPGPTEVYSFESQSQKVPGLTNSVVNGAQASTDGKSPQEQ